MIAMLPQSIAIARDNLNWLSGTRVFSVPGMETAMFGLILVVFMLFEPRGIYGRWVKIRTYFELFPFYRKDMFRRQKSYLKTERMR